MMMQHKQSLSVSSLVNVLNNFDWILEMTKLMTPHVAIFHEYFSQFVNAIPTFLFIYHSNLIQEMTKLVTLHIFHLAAIPRMLLLMWLRYY